MIDKKKKNENLAYKEMPCGHYVKSFFAKTERTSLSYATESREIGEELYRSRGTIDAMAQQQILG